MTPTLDIYPGYSDLQLTCVRTTKKSHSHTNLPMPFHWMKPHEPGHERRVEEMRPVCIFVGVAPKQLFKSKTDQLI